MERHFIPSIILWQNLGGITFVIDGAHRLSSFMAWINPTELRILEARNKPIGIAVRAIAYSGNGYKYWKHFEDDVQEEIETISKDINDMLFLPKTKKPITTFDVAVAGTNQMDLRLIFDLLNYSNDSIPNEEDIDGRATIKILNETKKVLQIVNSKEPCSLGLHPIIYFHSKKGNFKPGSFCATIMFVKALKKQNKFNEFIR